MGTSKYVANIRFCNFVPRVSGY